MNELQKLITRRMTGEDSELDSSMLPALLDECRTTMRDKAQLRSLGLTVLQLIMTDARSHVLGRKAVLQAQEKDQ